MIQLLNVLLVCYIMDDMGKWQNDMLYNCAFMFFYYFYIDSTSEFIQNIIHKNNKKADDGKFKSDKRLCDLHWSVEY